MARAGQVTFTETDGKKHATVGAHVAIVHSEKSAANDHATIVAVALWISGVMVAATPIAASAR